MIAASFVYVYHVCLELVGIQLYTDIRKSILQKADYFSVLFTDGITENCFVLLVVVRHNAVRQKDRGVDDAAVVKVKALFCTSGAYGKITAPGNKVFNFSPDFFGNTSRRIRESSVKIRGKKYSAEFSHFLSPVYPKHP